MTAEGPRKARLIPPGVTGRDLMQPKPKGHRVRVGQCYVSIPREAGRGTHAHKVGGMVADVCEVRGRMVVLRQRETGMTISIHLVNLRTGWRRK